MGAFLPVRFQITRKTSFCGYTTRLPLFSSYPEPFPNHFTQIPAFFQVSNHLQAHKGNRRGSRIRCRVEHVFGAQVQRAGTLVVRCIGLLRARSKIGLRNLAYNMDRLGFLAGVCRVISQDNCARSLERREKREIR